MPTFFDDRLADARNALARVVAGESPGSVESETLDCKEDPTTRGPSGARTAGAREDDDAARYFADETCCLANHEGGALIIGLDDKVTGTDALVGTRLDGAWLRNRIRELTLPALTVSVEELVVEGVRLLVVLVPRNAGSEPHSAAVSKRGRRTARRVGTGCHEMTSMAELLAWANERTGYDWSARPSGRAATDARPSAVEALRDYLRESGEPDRVDAADLADGDLLRRLQLVGRDGNLTRGGALLVCAGSAPRIVYRHRPAAGASSDLTVERSGRGLIEELALVVDAVSAANRIIALPAGMARGEVRALPPGAIREAIVNAIMHRDWEIHEPIAIDHTGDEMVVFSPGTFYGGVSEATLLTAPSRTRNRHLGDVLRSLRLAEREGTGVDRMFISLIALGHPPPRFRERDGGVRVALVGGDPVPEVLQVHSALSRELRDTARTAVAIHLLRQQPSLTLDELAREAQEDEAEMAAFVRAAEAGGVVRRTANPRPGGVPAWRFSDEIRAKLGPVLPYYARPAEESVRQIEALAKQQGIVRNQDVQDLLGIKQQRASQLLSRAEREGRIKLAPGAQPTGRGTAYVPA